LVFADAAGGDVRLVIVFNADGKARKTAQKGELSDVMQGIGNGPLEEFVHRGVKRLGTREIVIEVLERVKEALDFVGPGERVGVMPSGLAFGHGETPIKEVADMREDLNRRAAILAGFEVNVGLRGVANDFAGTVGDGGQ